MYLDQDIMNSNSYTFTCYIIFKRNHQTNISSFEREEAVWEIGSEWDCTISPHLPKVKAPPFSFWSLFHSTLLTFFMLHKMDNIHYSIHSEREMEMTPTNRDPPGISDRKSKSAKKADNFRLPIWSNNPFLNPHFTNQVLEKKTSYPVPIPQRRFGQFLPILLMVQTQPEPYPKPWNLWCHMDQLPHQPLIPSIFKILHRCSNGSIINYQFFHSDSVQTPQ